MTAHQFPVRQPWWLLGIVLVAALLGHDGLMASVAHAAPVGQVAPMAYGHEVAHPASDLKGSPPGDDPAPEHPSECGIVGTAAPFSGNPLEVSDLGTPAIFAHGDFSALAPAMARGWKEPFWPPGMRRALLQLYRI